MASLRFLCILPALVAIGFTVPVEAGEQPLAGRKLLLKSKAGKAEKQLLKLIAKGANVTIGSGNGSADDPTVHGGTLHLSVGGGSPFTDVFALPASAWRRIGKAGAGKGYALKGVPPIRTIVVKTGKTLKIVAKGAELDHNLSTSPEPVEVVLAMGAHRLCLSFGGTAALKPDKKFVAKNAPPPAACPASATTTSSSTTTTTLPGGSTSTLPGSTSTTTSTTLMATTTSTTLFVSFAQAPPAAIARLDEVLSAAMDLLNGGSTFDDVVTMLASEPDVSHVFIEGVTLLFTVAGIPTELHDGQSARLRDSTPATLTGSPAPPLAIGPIPAGAATGMPPTGQRMAGFDRDLDGRRDVAKKALVIAPYQYQFGARDSGQPVVTALGAREDYAGRVTFHEVAEKGTDVLPLSVWTSWHEYDVIHVSTHGESNRLSLGAANTTCTAIANALNAQLPDAIDQIGLTCSGVNTAAPNAPSAWSASLGATAAFFTWHYPDGLPKRLVYLDACRTTFGSGLTDALLGEDGIVLGWDEYVDAKHSRSSAIRFYEDVLQRGYPAWRSFVRQCAGTMCVEPTSAGLAQGQTKFAELEMAYDRGDLRLRENLRVVPPFVTGACLEDPEIPIEFTCPTCVDPTQSIFVVFDAIVEGVVPEDLAIRTDPLDFALEQLRLFADADGEDSGYANPIWAAPTVTSLGDGAWLFSPAQLAVPDVCPGEVVSYLPKLMLPAFDRAASGNENRDFSYPLDGPYELTFDGF